jgi:hypothetical protein
MNLQLLDNICQIVYPILWLSGYFLVSNYQKRIGFVLSAISIPLAMTSFLINGLGGSLITEIVASVLLGRGMYRAYKVEPERWR